MTERKVDDMKQTDPSWELTWGRTAISQMYCSCKHQINKELLVLPWKKKKYYTLCQHKWPVIALNDSVVPVQIEKPVFLDFWCDSYLYYAKESIWISQVSYHYCSTQQLFPNITQPSYKPCGEQKLRLRKSVMSPYTVGKILKCRKKEQKKKNNLWWHNLAWWHTLKDLDFTKGWGKGRWRL